jgi:uncharacterized protein YajQ (UPF0234 family)
VPSFDIVSQTDLSEVDNALQNVAREIAQRYDFKGSNTRAERKEQEIVIHADDDLKLRQMHDLIKTHFVRRKIEPSALDYRPVEKAAGQSVRQVVVVKIGIDKDLAKRLVKDIKTSKLKVQVAIQGEELRVSGKKRDDLQAVMTHVKSLDIEQPLQFVNFRD